MMLPGYVPPEWPWVEGIGVALVVSVLAVTVGWTGLVLGGTVVLLWTALPIVYPFAFGHVVYATFLTSDGALANVLYQAGLLGILFGPFTRFERSVSLTFTATFWFFLLIVLVAASQSWSGDVRVTAALLGIAAVGASFLIYLYGRYTTPDVDQNNE